MRIGIFDSGIGGLSVLNEAFHRLPDQEYIFYADTDHVPYGKRDPEEIFEYVREIAFFLEAEGVDAIVIACNTATSVAVRRLRQEMKLPIVGMEPAVKPAVEHTDNRRILVMATPVTLRETKLKALIERVDEEHRVDLLPMPELVNFAEKEIFSGPELHAYLEQQFGGYRTEDYSALVMGCTHFNYFKDSYREFFSSETAFMDGNEGTVRYLAHLLGLPVREMPEEEILFSSADEMTAHTTFYTSGRLVEDKDTLEHFLRLLNRQEEMRKISRGRSAL